MPYQRSGRLAIGGDASPIPSVGVYLLGFRLALVRRNARRYRESGKKPAEVGTIIAREVGMNVVSLNVGRPREVEWDGNTVLTSIFKAPVDRRLRVTALNVEGDEQSDLSVHGGVDKAVYVYPSEHYAYWRHELPGMDLPWAAFGENLTTEGLLEDVRIGDRFRIGSAEFVVTQPRLPCYKLGIRFSRMDMIKRFLKSGRTGFYFAVTTEGEVGAGDAIEPIARAEDELTVSDVVNLYTVDAKNQKLLQRAARSPVLPESWRGYFAKRLHQGDA
jgi:MOSC domain-containing protein YiiM